MRNEDFYSSLTALEAPLVNEYMLILLRAKEILEIGSGWGIFARSAMMANDDSILVTVDKIPLPQLPDFNKNTAGFEERITRMTGDSKEVLKEFVDETFDVVFVDGDHGYSGAYTDIENALRVVKVGGTVLIDDVLHHNNWKGDYGVMKALRDHTIEKKINFEILTVGNGVAVIKKR